MKNIKWNKRQQSVPFSPPMFTSAQASVSWVHVYMVSYKWSIVFCNDVHIVIAIPWKLYTRRVMLNKAPLQNSCWSLCINADTRIDWTQVLEHKCVLSLVLCSINKQTLNTIHCDIHYHNNTFWLLMIRITYVFTTNTKKKKKNLII